MIWGFCVYFVYMIPLETDVLRKHRFQSDRCGLWLPSCNENFKAIPIFKASECQIITFFSKKSFKPISVFNIYYYLFG